MARQQTERSVDRRQLLQGLVTAAALACLVSVAIITGTLEDQHGRNELLWRSPELAGKLAIPNRGLWGTEMVPSSVKDNLGTNNLKISDTIRDIKATEDQPNFAAALHKLERSTQSAGFKTAELTQPSDWLDTDVGTAQLPDPQGFVHRMQRLRLSSRYCRIHPESCKTLAPEFPGLDGMKYAADEVEKNPADPLEQGTAADLLMKGQALGRAVEAEDEATAGAQAMKVKKARTQSLFLDGHDGSNHDAGMPWLAPYFGQHGFQNHDDNVKWAKAAEKASEPYEQKADPLWCGAASCAEHSYARHEHSRGAILPHIVHNEAAIRIGGERYATYPGGGGGGSGYGYIPGTSIPTVVEKQAAPARLTDLAQVSHYKFPSKQLGERTYNGGGDSLLPHGQLWGLQKGGKTVRYHEYDGFYKGSQPDRAVVESPQQAAADSYMLESKELREGLKKIRAHNALLASTAAKAQEVTRGKAGHAQRPAAKHSGGGLGGLAAVHANKGDLEKGADFFRIAASPAGSVLPRLDKLVGTGKEMERGEGNDKSLPAMKGLDMSVVSHEAPTLALDQEERFQSAQEAQLARISRLLPSV